MFKHSNTKTFFKYTKKYFQIMTSEEYLLNMKESLRKTQVLSCKLMPFQEASILK